MFQTYLLLAFSILTTVVAQLLLRKGMMIVGHLDFSLSNLLNFIPNLFKNGYLLGGTFLFGIALLCWFFVLSRIQLSIAYPISTSLNLGLVALGSWIFFKEYLSVFHIAGIALIILGIFLIFLKP